MKMLLKLTCKKIEESYRNESLKGIYNPQNLMKSPVIDQEKIFVVTFENFLDLTLGEYKEVPC